MPDERGEIGLLHTSSRTISLRDGMLETRRSSNDAQVFVVPLSGILGLSASGMRDALRPILRTIDRLIPLLTEDERADREALSQVATLASGMGPSRPSVTPLKYRSAS